MAFPVKSVGFFGILGLLCALGLAGTEATSLSWNDVTYDGQWQPRANAQTVALVSQIDPLATRFGVGVNELAAPDAQCLGLSWPARGVIVDCVISGCVGAESGVKVNDVIVGVNGQPAFNASQFWSLLDNQPGNQVTLQVLRAGQQTRILVDPSGPADQKIALVAGMTQNPCTACPL
jgi:predicted metalloprotease with PDZ domain